MLSFVQVGVTLWRILIIILSCDFFGKVWPGISNWLGFSMVHHEYAAYHFLQYENFGEFPKKHQRNFSTHLIIMCVCDLV